MSSIPLCPNCGLPLSPPEWSEDISGIGDDFTNEVTFIDEDHPLCECGDASELP